MTEGPTPPAAGSVSVIEGAGATLMPGLVESHAHLGLADLGSYDLTRVPPGHMLITVRNAGTMLNRGLHERVLGRDRRSLGWTSC